MEFSGLLVFVCSNIGISGNTLITDLLVNVVSTSALIRIYNILYDPDGKHCMMLPERGDAEGRRAPQEGRGTKVTYPGGRISPDRARQPGRPSCRGQGRSGATSWSTVKGLC